MSRARQTVLLLGGLALVALVAYMAHRTRPLPGPSQQPRAQAGLAWLPVEAALVGAVNLAGLREQAWLLDSLERATGEVTQESSYRAFVEATGFDYTRDLDRLWLAVVTCNGQPLLVGVGEGRFAQPKIVAYARQQGAKGWRDTGITVYKWTAPPRAGQPERHFNLFFVDDTHIGFASFQQTADRPIDCWPRPGSKLSDDPVRAGEIARLAGGQQAWAVADTEEGLAFLLGTSGSYAELAKLTRRLAFGLHVSDEGLAVTAEARCREAAQAPRLRDNLRVMVLAGRIALGGDRSEAGRALAELLSRISVESREDTVVARALLPPATVASLLRARSAPALQP